MLNHDSVIDIIISDLGLADGNGLDLAADEEVRVSADDIIGAANVLALEELVVGGIATHPDHHIWADAHAVTTNAEDQRAGLTRRHAKLSQDLGARGDHLDFGQDRVGDEQDEPTVAPRVVDARREALGARERASQEYLRVKNDSGLGQRAPPRR